VQSLGGTTRISNRQTSYTYKNERRMGRKSYRINICLSNDIKPFRLVRKQERVKQRIKYFPRRSIVSVENVGVKEAQCIMIDSRDHLYITDDCIVTHNTLLTLASGLNQLLETHKYKKIIVTKPNIPISKQLSLGFLPGDLNAKMDPWLGGIWDNLDFLFSGKGKAIVDQYKEEGIIEVAALENIRGRSYNGGILVICDEAQNLSKHEIKSLVTRVGEDSKIILTGDINQIDNMYLDALNNGLSNLIEAFKPYGIASHVTFTKGERSELATLASQIL
jgi:predicted ribonuclease YlaK